MPHDARAARAAASPVPSVDPSSTTTISRHGRRGLQVATTCSIDARSLHAGIRTETARGSAIRRILRSSFARERSAVPSSAPVEHIFGQLAAARDGVGDQADQHDLEADDRAAWRRRPRRDVPERSPWK
jgi:hypothetical protein